MSDNIEPSSEPEVVEGALTPVGDMGQVYLASGERVSLRLWEGLEPGEPKPRVARDYETVGYVIAGRALLHLPDETMDLDVGGSWVVPAGVEHTYEVTEAFTAVEATSPPAQQAGRDS
jgi:quercetin dioxygenase-like cupin family protein